MKTLTEKQIVEISITITKIWLSIPSTDNFDALRIHLEECMEDLKILTKK